MLTRTRLTSAHKAVSTPRLIAIIIKVLSIELVLYDTVTPENKLTDSMNSDLSHRRFYVAFTAS